MPGLHKVCALMILSLGVVGLRPAGSSAGGLTRLRMGRSSVRPPWCAGDACGWGSARQQTLAGCCRPVASRRYRCRVPPRSRASLRAAYSGDPSDASRWTGQLPDRGSPADGALRSKGAAAGINPIRGSRQALARADRTASSSSRAVGRASGELAARSSRTLKWPSGSTNCSRESRNNSSKGSPKKPPSGLVAPTHLSSPQPPGSLGLVELLPHTPTQPTELRVLLDVLKDAVWCLAFP